MVPLASILFIFALIILRLASRQRKASGVPQGRVIYVDKHKWEPVDKSLFDPHIGLTGKPDYLVRQGKHIIPVEVKSSRVSNSPFKAHIYQLTAYCMLVESTFGQRPKFGILHYPNRTFRINYTTELESSLLDIIAEMRVAEGVRTIHRSHQLPQRCSACGYADICDQKLLK